MFSYNDIQTELVNIDLFDQKVIPSADGVDFLYTQITLKVTFLIHDAYLDSGGNPVDTALQLREKFLEPRKKLYLTFQTGGANFDNGLNQGGIGVSAVNTTAEIPNSLGGDGNTLSDNSYQTLLLSPPVNQKKDSNNGPMPLFCNITKILGNNGYVGTWVGQTWINPCKATNTAALSPLISNRFTMTHIVDADQLCTIQSRGVATFRTDLLENRDVWPDFYRDVVVPPIYHRFRRDHIVATQSPDGTNLTYETIDHELPVYFVTPQGANGVPNAVRCQVTKSTSIHVEGTLGGAVLAARDSHYQFKQAKQYSDQLARQREDEARITALDVAVRQSAISANKAQRAMYKSRTRRRPTPPPMGE